MNKLNDQQQDSKSLLTQGIAADNAGHPEEALGFFIRSAQADPRAAEPHLLMAAHHATHSRFEQAEAAYANALLLSPNLYIARYQMGLLQMTCSRPGLAVLTWQPLLMLSDDNALVHFVRGYTALANDDFSLALHHFDAGLERNGDNPALSEDIKKVVAKVQEIVEPGVRADAPPNADTQTQHVLLSNYLSS